MRHGVGEEYSQGFSVQLTRARGEAREQLNDTELVAVLDAGRPGERPVIQQLFRDAVGYAKDPVLREVSKANQQGVHIPQRANRRIQLLVDTV
ncbi:MULTISPECIES: hypothetical protein [unclassified Streptomyces]|uniref:hypothetical protein n=1 Tax=unclassified Streptomyces TaxID=2593676 RepID=UPI0033E977F2